ncbi:hypothetical protein [Ovoidimarina sediminis]|uniref:hypothetical protein n=1 Tax=Ovoidimarina sediminis TaxID=3079856 RepID=UPI0029095F2A|nr:hypothetical protein [Rhodophyticola sp. MJ-SS7]MDU8942625.1 hypothetical protein [Rhodophyticola sp. MJ-SS7]
MQDRLRLALSLVIIAACGGISLIGGFWVPLTGGLTTGLDPREFCRDVPTNASEADLSVQLIVVMAVPALIRLLRLGRNIGLGELALVPVFLTLAIGMLATMECGDLSRHPPYGTLIVWGLAAYPIAAFLMMFVRWPKLILP